MPIHLIFCFLSLFTLEARDEALQDFKRAFRPSRDAAAAHAKRAEALEKLAGRDSVKVAEALVEAYLQVEKELLPIEERRSDYLAGKRNDKDLRERTFLDPGRELQEKLLDQLVRMKDPVAVEFLVDRALSERRLGISVRIALARQAEKLGETACTRIAPLLKRTKDPEALLAALSACRGLGRAARSLGETVTPLLAHAEPAVRESAASALAAMCLPGSIAPLIDRLEAEEGRTRDRIAAVLQTLTRQNFGTSAHAWRRWLEGAGRPYLAGEEELGGGGEALTKKSTEPRYHEIPMDGRSILYVIDNSRSMLRTMTKPSQRAEEGEASRYTRARDELLRALEHLSPPRKFNIIAFARICRRFAPEMVEASERNIEEAQAWVKSLDLELGTVLYDALDLAFATAGKGIEDRYYDAAADTMFVLTDGHPYVGGKYDSRERIRAAVRHWNLLNRVVIHVIGLGDGVPRKWLERLALENGGKFVHEESREKKLEEKGESGSW